MTTKQKLGQIFIFITSLVASMTVPFALILSPFPTALVAPHVVVTSHSGNSIDYMVGVAQAIRRYCLGSGNALVPYTAAEDTPSTIGIQAIGHLDDVKALFIAIVVAAFVSFLIIVIVNLTNKSNTSVRLCKQALRGGAIAGLISAVLVGIFGVMNFDALFASLHSIFFAANSWYFPYDCLMISALPNSYWMAMGGILAALMAVIDIGIILWTTKVLRSL